MQLGGIDTNLVIALRALLNERNVTRAAFIVASSDLALTGPERLLAPYGDSLQLRTLKLPMKLDTYKLTQVWATRSHDDEAHRWLRGAIAKAADV